MKKLILILLTVVIFTGCSNINTSSNGTDSSTKQNNVQTTTPTLAPISDQTAEPTLAPTELPTEAPQEAQAKLEVIDTIQFDDYIIFAVENKGSKTAQAEISVTLYKNDEAVLATTASEDAVNLDGITLVKAWTEDIEYDRIEWDGEYDDSFYSDLSLKTIEYKEVSRKTNKVILKVTNNGKEPIQFLSVDIVFYKNGKPVSYQEAYAIDLDDELKPGKSKNVDIESGWDKKYNDIKFDDYKVYFRGRIS